MLPGIKRPLLIGKQGLMKLLLNGAWEEGTSLNGSNTSWLPIHAQTAHFHPSKDGSIDVRV